MTLTQTVEAYWMPGCSSCLRMKEFLGKSGKDFIAINADERPDIQAELAARGMVLPVARLGDTWISGVDLAQVAELIGVPYEPPVIMPAAELMERMNLNFDAAHATLAQLTPEMLEFKLPHRDRRMVSVAAQVSAVMRAVLASYYEERHSTESYGTPEELKAVDEHTSELLVARLEETRRQLNAWWEEDGFDDPLDRVIETYWGYPTLHEVLERELWHTTQHLRQLQFVLREFGVEPEIPLTEAHLGGLPLPDGIHEE